MVNCKARSQQRSRLRRGTSTVEMAFVLPVLLLVVFAIGDFGVAYTKLQNLTNATREGARAGVVFSASCVPGTVVANVQAVVDNYATSAGIPAGSINTVVTGACGGTGTTLTVDTTLTHTYLALAPLAGLAPTTDLRARSTMRNE